MKKLISLVLLSLMLLHAKADGLLGIDHRLKLDQSGVWSRNTQKGLEFGSAAVVLGGALWEGNESRLGKTFWKSTESMLMGDALAQVGKLTFKRQPHLLRTCAIFVEHVCHLNERCVPFL